MSRACPGKNAGWLRWIPAALLIAGMAGCAVPRQPVENVAELGPDDVIVVGRVELNPPLEGNDQVLTGFNTDQLKGKMYVITDENWREKHGPVGSGDEYFEAKVGEPFYIKSNHKSFFVLEGIIYTIMTGRTWETVEVPGGLKVELHSNDKAVYIGTLRYSRNEYFDITKSQIIDDYDRANAAFKKKFGVKYNLRKALVTPIKVKSSS